MEEYEKHKAELVTSRAYFKNQIESVSHEVERMLDTFSADRIHTLVTWKQMSAIKVNAEFIVNSKVKFVKYYQDKNIMKFTNYLKAGGTYGLQKHDCMEQCTVLQGSLYEPKRGNKIYKKGDIVIYKPFEVHKPSTKESTILKVIFSRLNCVEEGEIKCLLKKEKL
jgi:uncharacterized protein YukJ